MPLNKNVHLFPLSSLHSWAWRVAAVGNLAVGREKSNPWATSFRCEKGVNSSGLPCAPRAREHKVTGINWIIVELKQINLQFTPELHLICSYQHRWSFQPGYTTSNKFWKCFKIIHWFSLKKSKYQLMRNSLMITRTITLSCCSVFFQAVQFTLSSVFRKWENISRRWASMEIIFL